VGSDTLLEAKGLTVEFPISGGRAVHAVSGVDLDIRQGETLALVGESGCGKSTLGRALIGLLRPTAGEVLFKGERISGLSEKELRPFKGKTQLIFQDPYASLDPRMTVRDIIAEPLESCRACSTRDETTRRVLELMDAVGVPREFLSRYPHQFSGGQRQRIGIARAVATRPELIVCDEPVSALDVSVRNQILNLLKDMQGQFGLTYLFISHDLSVVRFLSDRTAVMFLGKLCELGPTKEVYENPLHPYTRFLLEAVPRPDPKSRGRERPLLTGDLPSPVDPPSGCRFRTRCPYARDICAEKEPEMRFDGGHGVACHFPK
jgi:oligopeptide transport system ATP-binding protein